MNVLLVQFRLEGMTEPEYRRMADDVAPAFASLPGLISKVWLADPGTNTYGGVYSFRDRRALDDFMASELFQGMGTTPGLVDIAVRDFATLEEPTRVTHGLVAAAV